MGTPTQCLQVNVSDWPPGSWHPRSPGSDSKSPWVGLRCWRPCSQFVDSLGFWSKKEDSWAPWKHILNIGVESGNPPLIKQAQVTLSKDGVRTSPIQDWNSKEKEPEKEMASLCPPRAIDTSLPNSMARFHISLTFVSLSSPTVFLKKCSSLTEDWPFLGLAVKLAWGSLLVTWRRQGKEDK